MDNKINNTMNNTINNNINNNIRMFDDLGRIVIPKNIRKKLNISLGSSAEIFVIGDLIILKKVLETNITKNGGQHE